MPTVVAAALAARASEDLSTGSGPQATSNGPAAHPQESVGQERGELLQAGGELPMESEAARTPARWPSGVSRTARGIGDCWRSCRQRHGIGQRANGRRVAVRVLQFSGFSVSRPSRTHKTKLSQARRLRYARAGCPRHRELNGRRVAGRVLQFSGFSVSRPSRTHKKKLSQARRPRGARRLRYARAGCPRHRELNGRRVAGRVFQFSGFSVSRPSRPRVADPSGTRKTKPSQARRPLGARRLRYARAGPEGPCRGCPRHRELNGRRVGGLGVTAAGREW